MNLCLLFWIVDPASKDSENSGAEPQHARKWIRTARIRVGMESGSVIIQSGFSHKILYDGPNDYLKLCMGGNVLYPPIGAVKLIPFQMRMDVCVPSIIIVVGVCG